MGEPGREQSMEQEPVKEQAQYTPSVQTEFMREKLSRSRSIRKNFCEER